VVTYAGMLLASIRSMHFPLPILPVMGAAPTLRQQSHVVTNRSERLANVTSCADCIRPHQLMKLGLKCEMACGRCGGEGIINPSNLS